jgi:hypothetical protein
MLLFRFWQGPFPPFPVVIPANAGIQKVLIFHWIPAFAGMTGMMKRRAYKAFS